MQLAWDDASPLARRLAMIGAVIALGLLGAFYSVVSHAVGRAESGREMARVAAERQVICSAFSNTSSRDLCLLTVATHAARAVEPRDARAVDRPIVHASFEVPAATRSPRIASARID